ncbi:polysialyltransferase family glycosyltransferase [Clostridium sp.]|uniref:polysialyltransferase family glycosyltransferase n=1 Tax=Clostridium sp. TaxID=1506 RepID=UPI003D6D993B
MTFIFIVFRPFHVISAYNIIKLIKSHYPNAKCIGYISNATDEFWENLFDYDKIFDEKYYSVNLFLEKNKLNVVNVLYNNYIIRQNINKLYLNNPQINGIVTFSDRWKIFQKVALKYKNVTNNNIVMDEGTSLYCKNGAAESSAIKKILRRIIYGWKFESCSMGENKITTKIYANYPEKVYAKSKKKYLMPKLDYSKIVDAIKVDVPKIISNKKKCLYISSPTFFLNSVDTETSIKSTIRLFEVLSQNKIEVYFKMHPANETIEDIKIYLDKFKSIKVIEDKSIPVELLCGENNFDYIISPLSSALLNLASFKFNCISLPYFATKFLEYRDILELFKANGIEVALNEEEMISIIVKNEMIIGNEKTNNLKQQLKDDNSEFLSSLME